MPEKLVSGMGDAFAGDFNFELLGIGDGVSGGALACAVSGWCAVVWQAIIGEKAGF